MHIRPQLTLEGIFSRGFSTTKAAPPVVAVVVKTHRLPPAIATRSATISWISPPPPLRLPPLQVVRIYSITLLLLLLLCILLPSMLSCLVCNSFHIQGRR
uniref:Uncharacterized protein n=1 Tax=Opuntia streptacantha TaxID=393608 RepID=A0A7C9CU03_OPUST